MAKVVISKIVIIIIRVVCGKSVTSVIMNIPVICKKWCCMLLENKYFIQMQLHTNVYSISNEVLVVHKTVYNIFALCFSMYIYSQSTKQCILLYTKHLIFICPVHFHVNLLLVHQTVYTYYSPDIVFLINQRLTVISQNLYFYSQTMSQVERKMHF